MKKIITSILVFTFLLFENLPAQNVGIGTATPGRKLEIAGDVRINGGVGVATTGVLEIRQSGDGVGNGIAITSSHGTSHRIWKASDGRLTFGTPSGIGENSLVLTTAGNVGIGTTTPGEKLHVNGNIRAVNYLNLNDGNNRMSIGLGPITDGLGNTAGEDDTYIRTRFRASSSSHNIHTVFMDAGGIMMYGPNTTGEIFRIQPNGNVGMGTPSPTARLHVNGTVRFQSLTNGLLRADGSGNLSTTNGSGIFTAGDGLNWSGEVLNSLWTQNGNHIYNNNTGNVGVGVTNPIDKLDVNGAARFHGTSGTTRYNFTTQGGSSGDWSQINLNVDGNMGTGGLGGAYFIYYGDGRSRVWNRANNHLAFGTNNSERMRIENNGNVGIGTPSPIHRLHVEGSAYIPSGASYWIGSGTDSGDRLRMHLSGSNSYIDYATGSLFFRSGTTTRVTLTNGGVIGIGTTNPNVSYLDNEPVYGLNIVKNPAVFGSAVTEFINNSGSQSFSLFAVNTSASNNHISIRGISQGNQGTGVNGLGFYGVTGSASTVTGWSGYFNWDTYVDWLFYGGSTQVSDKKLKNNVERIGYGLELVSLLNPVSYDRKIHQPVEVDNSNMRGNVHELKSEEYVISHEFGLIAQEVEEILPELVKGKEMYVNGEMDYIKGVNYIGLIPLLISAIQEQQDMIQSQNSRIESLESLISGLQNN